MKVEFIKNMRLQDSMAVKMYFMVSRWIPMGRRKSLP
jgi:hypothetical protein